MSRNLITGSRQHVLKRFGECGWHHQVDGDWSTIHGSCDAAIQAVAQFRADWLSGEHYCVAGHTACNRICGICGRPMRAGRDEYFWLVDGTRDKKRKKRREKIRDEKNAAKNLDIRG